MGPDFFMRDLSLEDACQLLSDAGFTVAEYQERLDRSKSKGAFGIPPPSILWFVPGPEGWTVEWKQP